MVSKHHACTSFEPEKKVEPALTALNMSTLAEHAINHHYDIAWEDAIVVDADPHMYCRRTLEAWHIRQEPNPMNRDRGLLPPVYDRTHPPPDTH